MNESADSARQNEESTSLGQLHLRAEERRKQCLDHERVEDQEHLKADIMLQQALSALNVSINESELKDTKTQSERINDVLSIEERIKIEKKELQYSGKTSEEILSTFILGV